MSTEITLTLPDDVLRRAQLLAQRSHRPVGEVLTEALELSFNPMATRAVREELMGNWSDAQVLAAADAHLSESDDARLGELLDRQQAGLLSPEERSETTRLMERYQDGLLDKARALREAVRRGLREPLQP
jgi:predicted transcriptional regulator